MIVIVIEATVAIFGPILSLLLMLLMRKFKINVEHETVDKILSKVIGFGEQKAKQALKDGKPLSGPEVAQLALQQAEYLAVKSKLPKWATEKLSELIESKLGESKLNTGSVTAPKEAAPKEEPVPAAG